jgi:microcystin-dependent protein
MDPLLGSIVMVAFNFAPRGWALCEGQLLSIAQNTALFSLLGTTFGGNGQTTFALPDLRGRVPLHPGQGRGLPAYQLGQVGGAASVTLTTANLPQHNHPFAPTVSNASADQTDPTSGIPAVANTGSRGSSTPAYTRNASTGAGAQQTTGTTGSGTPVNTEPPYLGLNFIIALEGIFPSRN